MDSPVLISSSRSPFDSPDFSRPRPRTLFSPNDSIAPKKLSMHFRDENEDHFESSAESAVPEVVGGVAGWCQRSEPLYDNESCTSSPWRRPISRTLPTLPRKGADAVTRVSCETIYQLVRGDFKHSVDEYAIVDCRFDYEHNGGHIEGAISINRKERLSHFFQQMRARVESGVRVAIVFHCEYSQHRGPKAYRFFRSLDRQCNVYPHLSFPDLYVMDGGYRAFFSSYVQQCEPMCYVPMDDPVSKQCTRDIAQCRRSWNDDKCSSSRMRSRSRITHKPVDSRPPVPSFQPFTVL